MMLVKICNFNFNHHHSATNHCHWHHHFRVCYNHTRGLGHPNKWGDKFLPLSRGFLGNAGFSQLIFFLSVLGIQNDWILSYQGTCVSSHQTYISFRRKHELVWILSLLHFNIYNTFCAGWLLVMLIQHMSASKLLK